MWVFNTRTPRATPPSEPLLLRPHPQWTTRSGRPKPDGPQLKRWHWSLSSVTRSASETCLRAGSRGLCGGWWRKLSGLWRRLGKNSKQCKVLYCMTPGLDRYPLHSVKTLALRKWCHCIVTLWLRVGPISSSHTPYLTYMHSPLCLLLATLCLSSPQDTHGLSGPPHMTYCLASCLVKTPPSLLVQSFFQDSKHGGITSG